MIIGLGLADSTDGAHSDSKSFSTKGSLGKKINDQIFQTGASVKSYLAMRRAHHQSTQPKRLQHKTLRRILDAQKDTEFGRHYKFKTLKTSQDFRKELPLFDYEDLRPFIERQELTGKAILNYENPILYAMTSGTTGKPKYIPILRETMKRYSEMQGLFFASVVHEDPSVLRGRIAGIVSPAVEGHFPGTRTPVGSTSGQIYKEMPSLVKAKYVFPTEIFEIEDYDLKYKTFLRLLLNSPDVTYFGTANPSTLVKLIGVLNQDPESYLKDLHEGGFHALGQLPKSMQSAVSQRIRGDSSAARRLAKVLEQRGSIRFQDFLPNLKVVTTWTGGSCAIFLNQLEGQFALNTVVRELGYLSSEFRGTIPLSRHAKAGLPMMSTYYYEFVAKEDWEAGRFNFKEIHEIQNREQYYVFITTDSGLYRYKMNDIVEVDGFLNQTPLIRFVQKGKGVTNITGEKLYENQVIYGVQYFEKMSAATSAFYVCTADEENARYNLYYEPVSEQTDSALGKRRILEIQFDEGLRQINLEYDVKRKSGRLKEPSLQILRPGSFEKFKSFFLAAGQREGQFKIVALGYERDMKFDFKECSARAVIPQANFSSAQELLNLNYGK